MTKLLELQRSLAVAVALVACSMNGGVAQTEPEDAEPDPQPIWLFQSFFADATVTGPYLGGGLSVREFDVGSAVQLDAVGGYALTSQIELKGRLGYTRIDPGEGSSTSGFTDLLIGGHYVFEDVGEVQAIAAGAYMDLPIGKRSVGGNTVDFGAYGAVRHAIDDRTTLAGNVGLAFVETTDFKLSLIGFCDPFYFGYCATPLYQLTRKTSLSMGGGAVYAVQDDLHLVGEFRVETVFDYAALSGGLDYAGNFGNIRGLLALGLDDGAPDVALTVQLLRSLR